MQEFGAMLVAVPASETTSGLLIFAKRSDRFIQGFRWCFVSPPIPNVNSCLSPTPLELLIVHGTRSDHHTGLLLRAVNVTGSGWPASCPIASPGKSDRLRIGLVPILAVRLTPCRPEEFPCKLLLRIIFDLRKRSRPSDVTVFLLVHVTTYCEPQ